MQKLDRILVAIDGLEGKSGLQNALTKAAFLEHYSGAEIEIAEAIWDSVANEPEAVLAADVKARLIERLMDAERQDLRSAMAAISDKVATLQTRVVWSPDPAAALAAEAADYRADLVIKAVSEHHGLRDQLITPTDMALMRESACPVLVSMDKPWPEQRTVLVALDVTDEAHAGLNGAIVQAADTMARMLAAKVHLLTAYPTLNQAATLYPTVIGTADLQAQMAARRRELLQGLAAGLSEPVEGVHVVEDHPAHAIAELASTTNACLVIVGTAARHGLQRLLLGNTAERIVARVGCDLLSVPSPER